MKINKKRRIVIVVIGDVAAGLWLLFWFGLWLVWNLAREIEHN